MMSAKLFEGYLRGVQTLLKRLGQGSPVYYDVIALQAQLMENIDDANNVLDTDDSGVKRARIITQLNKISLDELGISFNELCFPKLLQGIIPNEKELLSGESFDHKNYSPKLGRSPELNVFAKSPIAKLDLLLKISVEIKRKFDDLGRAQDIRPEFIQDFIKLSVGLRSETNDETLIKKLSDMEDIAYAALATVDSPNYYKYLRVLGAQLPDIEETK